jgi:hypothetical protein
MKTKIFILTILFMGISAFMYAQTESSAPDAKKDAKSGECTGHANMGVKADCKWVDADTDGKCDKCGKTEKECKEACAPAKQAPATTSTKKNCATTCPHSKDCGKTTGTAPSKEGNKNE